MEDMLLKGLLGKSDEPNESEEHEENEDLEMLFEEFRGAEDAKSGLAALRLLVKKLG